MCWCLFVLLDVMDDPGKLGVSTPALLYKASPKLAGMFIVFLNVDDLHLLGVLGFGCVARCNG